MGHSSLPKKATEPHLQFLAHVYCGQTAGWIKTPLGTEIDLGPGHFVLDGFPAIGEKGTAALLFSAHTYCGHGRSSQLLLSSCIFCVCVLQFFYLSISLSNVKVKVIGQSARS